MLINLYMEMKKKKIKQGEMAKALGVSQQTMSAKLNGKIPMTVDELMSIKKHFFPDSSLEYLAKKVAK